MLIKILPCRCFLFHALLVNWGQRYPPDLGISSDCATDVLADGCRFPMQCTWLDHREHVLCVQQAWSQLLAMPLIDVPRLMTVLQYQTCARPNAQTDVNFRRSMLLERLLGLFERIPSARNQLYHFEHNFSQQLSLSDIYFISTCAITSQSWCRNGFKNCFESS